MRKELQEIENIENYLMGKMNANEKAEFEKRLETDAKLAENLELQKSLIAGLERVGLKNDLVKAKRSLFLRKVWTWFGAMLLLAVMGWFSIQYFSADVSQTETEIVESATDQGLKIKEESLVNEGLLDEGLKIKDESSKIKEARGERLEVRGEKLEVRDEIREERVKVKEEGWKDATPDFVEIPVKQAQTFTIDPTKANTITGAEGTVIDFPANAFDTQSNEMVTIQLKEFYKLSDMVFANLTTQTKDGELIETGGMVHVEAFQGSKIDLAEGKAITLNFPFEKKKEGMKTFAGEEDEFGKVVWEEEMPNEGMELPQEQANRSLIRPSVNFERIETFTMIEEMPIFPGCEGLVSRKLKENCTSEKITEYLSENAKYPSYNSEITGKNKVFVTFTINEWGLVQSAKVTRSSTPELNKYAIAAVKSLPRLNPGKQRGVPVKVQYTIPVTYNMSENSANGLNEIESQRYMEDVNKRFKEANNKELEDVLSDSTMNEENRLNMAQGYVLSSANLGWINCDSYPFAKNGKSSFNIFAQNEKINCSLVLHSVRGIVSPRYIKQGKYIFPQLPNKEEVSVLAFKTEQEKNYVSYYKTTHDKSDHTFEFEPLTKERLQQITQELDAIRN